MAQRRDGWTSTKHLLCFFFSDEFSIAARTVKESLETDQPEETNAAMEFEIVHFCRKLAVILFLSLTLMQATLNFRTVRTFFESGFTKAPKNIAYFKESTDKNESNIASVSNGKNTTLQRLPKKKIVLWPLASGFQMDKVAARANKQLSKEECDRCEYTNQKDQIEDPDTAAIVFHYYSVFRNKMPSPRLRRADQLYVWMCNESPAALMYGGVRDLRSIDKYQFNATMSYRRDSDIYKPYGQVSDMLPTLQKNLTSILQSKDRLATAVVSNCYSMPGSRKRMDYLRQILQSGFKLDARGACFPERGLSKEEPGKIFMENLNRYKFYFAFENSYHCRDYITEKVFRNCIEANSVPVVWGAQKSDYEAVLPKNSFIFAEDFPSLKSLTDYLEYLNKNDTAYLGYFRWRTHKYQDPHLPKQPSPYCQLCRIVHGLSAADLNNSSSRAAFSQQQPPVSAPVPRRRLMSAWLFGSENPACMSSDAPQTMT